MTARPVPVVCAVLVVVVVADQVTKALAEARLPGRTVEVVPGVLDLVLVRNPGAAFSLGGGAGGWLTVVLALLAAGAVAAVLLFSPRVTSRGWAVVLGLVGGGAGGNLVDRLVRAPGPLRGEVVDFLRLPNWPVFNVADMALVGGAGLAVLLTLRGVEIAEERPTSSAEGPGTSGG